MCLPLPIDGIVEKMCGKAIEFAVGLRYTVRNGDLLRCAAESYVLSVSSVPLTDIKRGK